MATKQPKDKSYFILPDLGEGVHEAELIRWRVAPGDTIDEHQTLAEMETDKALVEVPSPWPGVISELHGREGDIIIVGNKLVSYQIDGTRPAPVAAAAAAGEQGGNRHQDAGTVVGSVAEELTVPARFRRHEGGPADTATKSGWSRSYIVEPGVRPGQTTVVLAWVRNDG